MFIRLLILCLIIGASSPSFALEEVASAPQPTLSLEVALTYQKKTKKSVDFQELAKKSPVYANAPAFAKTVLLHQEVKALKNIYDSLNDKSGFIIFDDFEVKELNRDDAYFSFKDFDENNHYIYEYNGEVYVVFIRNIDEYKELPIRESTSFYIANASMRKMTIAAELTLRPTYVDEKPFILEDGREANLILTDLIDIKLIRYESGKVFYHDIATEWKPKSRIDRIIKDLGINNTL